MPHPAYDQAVQRAAGLLSGARLTLIAGLRTDAAGIVAAVRLAESVGGVIDHAACDASLTEIDVLQSIGLMLATPAAAHQEADTLLLIGGGRFSNAPSFEALLTPYEHHPCARLRQVIVLGADAAIADRPGMESFSLAPDNLGIAGSLAVIRARLNGRPLASGFDATDVERCVSLLTAAKYGVAMWRTGDLDALEAEMLVGLIKDLNQKTRWSGLPLAADPTATAASTVLGWMTAFPPRTGFARGHAEHDPWANESRRLVKSGESDLILWISAFGDSPPAWIEGVPSIVLSNRPEHRGDAVSFTVGRPGADHAGVLYDPLIGSLAESPAQSPGDFPSVATVLTDIREALPAP